MRLPKPASVRARLRGASRRLAARLPRRLPQICDSVAEWAQDRDDVEVRQLAPPGSVAKRLPNTVHSAVPDKFSRDMQTPIPAKYLARIPRARIVGRWGVVVLPDGTFSAESMYARSHLVVAPTYLERLPSTTTWRAGNYCSLLIEYAIDDNYYHFMHDVMLRLFRVLDHLPPDTLFVVPPDLKPFQYDAFELVGIGRDRLCEFDGTQVWELENLFFTPPTTLSGGDSPDADAWLRDLALAKCGITPGPAERRVYISRRTAKHRRLVNEPEVESLLASYGFEIHQLENYSLREQVALFAEAAVVAGPHGGGHTNILFAPPGLIVIDIFGDELNKCFWNMSNALGHDYWYLGGEAVANDSRYTGDIHVSLDKLAETLNEALLRRERRTRPIHDSVLAWCESRGMTDVVRLRPAFSVTRQPARTIAAPHPHFDVPPSYDVPEKYLAVVPGARLVGPAGMVMLPDGSFAAESVYHRQNVESSSEYTEAPPSNPVQKSGRYYSLVIAHGDNYYHWLHDAVLRLHQVVELLPDDVRFVVPSGLVPAQLDALQVAGVSDERLVEFDGSEIWEFESLWFSPPNMHPFVDSPPANRWFRDLALRSSGAVQSATRRLYISRRNATYRRLVNEAEVRGYLERRGFESVELETLTFADQVRLFAQAEVVVGAHGAGFTNILFAPEGAVVLDVVQSSVVSRCYWTMSEAMGHNYWYLVGDDVPIVDVWQSDIRVAVERLAATLDEALAG